MKIVFIYLITGLCCLISCLSKKRQDLRSTVTTSEVTLDTINSILNEALIRDVTEFDNWEPFIFIRAGHLINPTRKNLIMITCPTDSTYTIKLYYQDETEWFFLDSISNLDARKIQFDLELKDFDFDDQNDIYIQVSATNGYTISKGHLITFDTITNKMLLHPEARNLGNITPDKKRQLIIAEAWAGFGLQNSDGVKRHYYKWTKGKLINIKTD